MSLQYCSSLFTSLSPARVSMNLSYMAFSCSFSSVRSFLAIHLSVSAKPSSPPSDGTKYLISSMADPIIKSNLALFPSPHISYMTARFLPYEGAVDTLYRQRLVVIPAGNLFVFLVLHKKLLL